MSQSKTLDPHPPGLSVQQMALPDGALPSERKDVLGGERESCQQTDAPARDLLELTSQLTHQRQRLDSIIANVPGVVWETSLKPGSDIQSVDFVSDYVETMLGYSIAEFHSAPDFWLSIVHPDDRRNVKKAISGVSESVSNTIEFRWIAKDGRVVWVQSNCRSMTNDRGEVIGFRGVMIDITRRKQAEEAVRESEERYRLLFDSNPVPMWVFDRASLRFLEVNDAAVRVYGYSREEFLAMTVDELVVDSETQGPSEVSAWESRPLEGSEATQHRLKDGTIINVEKADHHLWYKGHAACIVLANDVTKRRAIELQHFQRQRLESVGMLAGGIAHDFNNVLSAIMGYSDLAIRDLGDENSSIRSRIVEVRRAAEIAASLTRQLLAFSRKQVLEPKVLNLNSSVSAMENMLRRLIGEHIELRTELDPEIRNVEADPGQIEQIVMNLVVNARDAMPQGGKITIETSNVRLDDQYAARHVGVKPGHYVQLAISDTGPGIDEEVRSRIFEPFYTTKEAGKGTGLGLSTTYGIVKQSGGNIWVYSEAGRGTTFKIYLPIIDTEVSLPMAIETMEDENLIGSETILVAEDEEMVRNITCQILEMYGYKVLPAADGAEAVSICREYEEHIDALLTDVVMPDITGRELSELILNERPGLEVIFMSGYAEGAVAGRDLLAEGAHFVQKPFSAEGLGSKVREVLAKRVTK